MGSWSFASSQRGLAASLLIGIGALGGASSCCSAVWFAVACPTAEQGSRQNGPGGAALATCMLFSAPERIPGRPGRARPGRSPAHSPGARRDFGILALRICKFAVQRVAAQIRQQHSPPEGGGLPLQGIGNTATAAFFACCSLRCRRQPATCHATMQRARRFVTRCQGRGLVGIAARLLLSAGMSSWVVCSGLQWFAVVCSGLGLG